MTVAQEKRGKFSTGHMLQANIGAFSSTTRMKIEYLGIQWMVFAVSCENEGQKKGRRSAPLVQLC
jgi:hypothetical protein